MKKSRNYILMLLTYTCKWQFACRDCCRTECTVDNSCDCEITSRSYLAVRPLFQSASPEKVSGFRSDRFTQKKMAGMVLLK